MLLTTWVLAILFHACNKMAKQIWEWCIDKDLCITVAHISGKQNLVVDYESRRNQRESEWMIDKALLLDALEELNFKSEIDLFATPINKQFSNYASHRTDPQDFAVNIFSLYSNLI